MAGLQRRGALGRVIEARLVRSLTGVAAVVVSTAAAAPPLAAQAAATTPDSPVASAPARALLDLDLGIAEMASRAGVVGGARGLVQVTPGLRVGLAGHQVVRRLDDVPSRTGPDRTLAFGYAGAVFEVGLPGPGLSLRALVGAGAATVRDRFNGTRVGSDVVGVFAPELVAELVRRGPLALTAGGGYRAVFSVDGPERLSTEDLRSPFLSFSLRIGPL